MYILECSDGSYYTGSTIDLERRLQQHQDGEGANHTKKRLPVKLVYYEEFQRIDEAFYREKQVQGWSRKKKEALINGDFDKLRELASTSSANSTKKVASTSSATGSTGSATGSTGSASENVASTGSATGAPLPEPVTPLPEPVEGNDTTVEESPEPAEVQPEPAEVQPEPAEELPEPAEELPEPVEELPEPVEGKHPNKNKNKQ
ncbi:MAG: GIY-YIG nuclease family protein [Bacteroidales bacterium]